MPDAKPQTFGDLEPSRWPGERLGLPAEGRGSVARPGRRIAALLVDWASAMLISLLFTPYESAAYTWVTPLVFAVLQIVFIPTIGGSLGHRLLGMRVIPLEGGWIGVRRPVVRTALLLIVIPALVWDSDQRGFHDKVAGTVLIRY
ncbi:putative RDD family membrane protein YckC [Agromyces hippuratus]|uniref:Putative RDD family membrane protein YckC n=1 Tax=Agromyces hippuratus TaxID=286438 RepID=A0A852WV45_9MICO|nr:RDD family protein [Agromyces hippuratus]NYG19843.1 putative RDD family membrane protein YckC [Agromyces hippuratus]